MNIFEALEAGDGKATLPEVSIEFYVEKGYTYESTKDLIDNGSNAYRIPILIWNKHNKSDFPVTMEDLKRNDWIPYVPRGTCGNCETIPKAGQRISITHDGKCSECKKQTPYKTTQENRKGDYYSIVQVDDTTLPWFLNKYTGKKIEPF